MDFRIDEFDVFEKGDFMETIRNVEINQLHDFKNHPFKVEINTELCELMKSIEKEGVLVPLLVRTNPYGDGYEVISGHRRKEAAIYNKNAVDYLAAKKRKFKQIAKLNKHNYKQ